MSFTLCMSFGTESARPPTAAAAMFSVAVFFTSFMGLGSLMSFELELELVDRHKR